MSFKNIVLSANTSRILQFYRRKHRDSDVVVLVHIIGSLFLHQNMQDRKSTRPAKWVFYCI